MELMYPFLHFSEDKQEACCCSLLPVSDGSDLALKSPDLPASFSFDITNIAGIAIRGGCVSNNGAVDLSALDLSQFMAPGDCFRIKAGNLLSNPFLYIGCNTENTCLFEFWNERDTTSQKVRLKCILDKPQSKTEQTEYTDANGIVHRLSKTRRKEYELTFDFYPEFIHDAIKEMLNYPFVAIDNVLMYESGDYEIEWDKKDENKNAKATTKLSEQSISRFTTCQ